MTKPPLPWEIWWADFNPQVGREQAGQRPAVIVSTRLGCQLATGLAVVVPCTTTNRKLPFHPALHGLNKPTYAMCEQVKSISHRRLRSRHPATLADTEISEIRRVLRMLIDVSK